MKAIKGQQGGGESYEIFGNSAPCTGGIWYHVATILGSIWDNVGIMLGSFWDLVGIMLGSFWDQFWDHMRTSLAGEDHFGP